MIIRTVILVLSAASMLHGRVLPNPTITASHAASGTTTAVGNVFENTDMEYRTNGAGNNTFVEFDFGANVVIDGFLNVTRNSTSSVVTGSRLIFNTDGTAGFNTATDNPIFPSSGPASGAFNDLHRNSDFLTSTKPIPGTQ